MKKAGSPRASRRKRQAPSGSSTGQLPGQSQNGSGGHLPPTIRQWGEREKPDPSSAWQAVAFFFLASAVAAGLAALTVPEDAAVTSSELWISTIALVALSVTCFIAHWDINRGRKIKRYEIEEPPPPSDA